ncbi:MAG: HAMP domain-containing protein [Polyangiaceae bacterium]|nr:HAMP domain-containing protein [Polyangiaceae bacterium]
MGWLARILGSISVRGKIIGTIVVVSSVVLVLGAWAAFHAVSAAKQRGRYLERPFGRYRARIEAGIDGMTGAAQLVARDPGLVSALIENDPNRIQSEASRLARAFEGNAAPEILILSDAAGNTFRMGNFPSLSAEQWREYRMRKDLLQTGSLASSIGIVARVPYLVGGAAVRDPAGQPVGTVLVGELLKNTFWEIAKDSHENALQQHRLTLFGEGKIHASTLPKEDQDALIEAWGAQGTARDGPSSVPVLNINGHTYDFWAEPLSGYERKNLQQIGTLLLITERTVAAQGWSDYSRLAVYFGLALLLALGIGWVLAVGITRPLRRYIVATEGLGRGQGDLTRRLPVETRDELGELAQNLNRVFAKIHTLAAGVQRSAFQVNASSGEISAVSKLMLDGAKEQAGKIANSTAAATELSSSIQQVAENAAEATRTARQSGEAVQRAIRRLQEIRRAVEDAAGRIATLGESGKRIGNIVEVIRQISEQTSMLALNAAIEAAHAGEHGRGFAVVADEVSSLAKRTGQSAKDIEDLIATIRDQTGEAVRVMQSGTREVEEGTGLVEATLADLQTLVNVINDTAAAVQEQAVASDEIARNMDIVQRITTSVVASSEQAVTQGEKLLSLADGLAESVGGFKIDPERVALDAEELKALPEHRK